MYVAILSIIRINPTEKSNEVAVQSQGNKSKTYHINPRITAVYSVDDNWLVLLEQLDSRYSQQFCTDLFIYLCLSADFHR